MKIYRDDDIDNRVDMKWFKPVHEEFLKRNKIHTVAMLCYGLENNPDLVSYIKSTPNFDIQLHGWGHIQYSLENEDTIRDHINCSLDKLKQLFNVMPTKWYLPWNGWVKDKGFSLVGRVAEIAKGYNLDVDIDCCHIGCYLGFISGNPTYAEFDKPTIYFHSWSEGDRLALPQLLDH